MKSSIVLLLLVSCCLAQSVYPRPRSTSSRAEARLSERSTPVSFNLYWSGAVESRSPYGAPNNAGHAEGVLVMDTSQLPSGPFVQGDVPTSAFISLQLNVTSPDYGFQQFTLNDFSFIYFNSPIALDFTKELVNQTEADGSFGNCYDGYCGDFNLFGNSNNDPYGLFYFNLAAAEENYFDCMLLISFSPIPSSVCGNGIVEGQEQCDGGSCCSSTCTFTSSSTVCRASAGVCDVAETCSGSAASCPSDSFEPSTYTCRPAVNSCDIAEMCTGSSVTCPADQVKETASCFCARQNLASGAMGYYCDQTTGFYQCLGGAFASQSRDMACAAGTHCGCGFGVECSCGGSKSPCVTAVASQTC